MATDAQGMKRANYFADFSITKAKKAETPKIEKKSMSVAEMLGVPMASNEIYIIPRTGGLVSLVCTGRLFQKMKPYLESKVESLKPNQNGTMSDTAKELALRWGFGNDANGYVHCVEGVLRTLVSVFVHTFYHKAKAENKQLKVFTYYAEDTAIVREVDAPVEELTLHAMMDKLEGKRVPRATLRMGIAIGTIPGQTAGNEKVRIMIHENYYRFKETLEAEHFTNERKPNGEWTWEKNMNNAAAAMQELKRIYDLLEKPSMVLELQPQDHAVLEAWEQLAGVDCITTTDGQYLTLDEMGF